MFSPSDFSTPTTARPPIHKDRVIGALVLLLFVIACMAMALGMDSVLFDPYNATHAVTQTWQAAHPNATSSQPTQRAPRSRRTPTPDPDYNQQVRNLR